MTDMTTALIIHRRRQLVVHSYIYYRMNTSIVSDDTWQRWADELVELQHGGVDVGVYDDAFRDWDGSTGFHLPQGPEVFEKASKLRRYHETIERLKAMDRLDE